MLIWNQRRALTAGLTCIVAWVSGVLPLPGQAAQTSSPAAYEPPPWPYTTGELATKPAARASSLSAGVVSSVPTSYLEGRWPVAVDQVTAHGSQMFGDQVNLFRGSLSFENTDLSLPSHHSLAVELIRRRDAGRPAGVPGKFGDWDLIAPRIGGSFTSHHGWQVNQASSPWARCSVWAPPPPWIRRVINENLSYPVTFVAHDFHHGIFLDVPGAGAQEVLRRSAAFTAAPADGEAYPYVTRNLWQIRCLPSVLNAPGEGFEAVSPEGVRYTFNWMVVQTQPAVRKQGTEAGRSDMYLMATEVRDRFGNHVTYRYDPANPSNLMEISASDGRRIRIGYVDGRVAWATDETRTLHYTYNAFGDLKSLLMPDGSRWQFELEGLSTSNMSDMGEGANCDRPGTVPPDDLEGSITHPSGAKAQFRMAYSYHSRTYVERRCLLHPLGHQTVGAMWPRMTASQTLLSKTITGPGLPTLTWRYGYGGGTGGWLPCTGCADRKTVTVFEPDGGKTEHDYGIRWRVNEGQLLTTREGWTGSEWLRVTDYRYRAPAGERFADEIGATKMPLRNDWLGMRFRPLDRKQITQQGATFTWEVAAGEAGFDALARPQTVTQSSSLGFSRTERTVFSDHLQSWRLGQVALRTVQGIEAEATEFHPSTALPTVRRVFGLAVEAFDYFSDGSLYSITAAGGRTTWLGPWFRGQPAYVTHADGSHERQQVNNLGAPDWRTNAEGTTHRYAFDSSGRLRQVTYPSEHWGEYHPTWVYFDPVSAPSWGMPAGHWRQHVVTGKQNVYRIFDALWRERVEFTWDADDWGGTVAIVETRYDAAGRKSFVSHPTRDFAGVDQNIPGTWFEYDALGRVISQKVDSESGPLLTRTAYLPVVFQRRVTDPRGHVTTTAFQAWDTPSEDTIAQIWAPEGVHLAIHRDVFGKATAITRGGPQPGGGTHSATRRYVYDEHQRLCKTLEPEIGATVQHYDAANNVAWRASGLNLPDASRCDRDAVPGDRTVYFHHDLMGRLRTTRYGPDATQGAIARDYTRDGLLKQVVASRAGQNTIVWDYEYWNRRTLKSEKYTWGDPANGWTFFWQRDAHGHVSSLSDPWGTLHYSPDALGRPKQVSGFAGDVRYHANGMLAGYTLANGIRHNTMLNRRGLPEVWEHVGVSRDVLRYDAAGNISAIEDLHAGRHRSMPEYDGLNRLRRADGPWGAGRFEYDALDNLRSSIIGGRSLTHHYDGHNRLVGLSGSQSIGIGYDANGNVTQRGSQAFVFDIGNRIQQAVGKASYVYDGHGRRNLTWFAGGGYAHSAYTLDGRLRASWRLGQGGTRHVYLGDRLIAEVRDGSGPSFAHTDFLGSPVARTNSSGAVTERTEYEPYGATHAGTNPTGIGFTGHVNDADTGLVYMQQRYYDPIAGMFLSVDPVTTDTMTGSSFNRYEYAGNNPYKYVDPDGREKFAAVVKLLENGGHKIVGTLRDKADAVAARLRGDNVMTATSQHARQVEVAAHGAGDALLRHKGHKLEDGSTGMPHYQTDGKPGHTFWGQGGGILPELLEAVSIPFLLSPSSLAPATLYGPGTRFPTREAFDKANGASTSSASGASNAVGFQGVFRVSGRIESKMLDKELSK